jgi:hypothetical protein
MTAGLNIRLNVWRMTVDQDDVVGGALYTGTVVYQDLRARFTQRRPSQLLAEQGLETEKIADLLIQGRSITVFERDEIEIVWPLEHVFYGDRFRVLGVQPSSRRAKYGPKQYTVSRIVRSRSQQ